MPALAIAYQVQCRLSDVAPVRDKGFDHTRQGSYSQAAGVSKILGLDESKTANAIAISGTAFNALRVTRTGNLSHWKGLAFPNTAACCTWVVFLAMHGTTGPLAAFEGDKGFMDVIAGVFDIDWLGEDLERVKRAVLKRFNAEIHSQAGIQGVLDLKQRHRFGAAGVERIDIETFDAAFNIIGGGDEGDKMDSIAKEHPYHSLPYVIAVAILDGDVMPAQYGTAQDLPRRCPESSPPGFRHRKSCIFSAISRGMPCRLQVVLRDGQTLVKEIRDYPGFLSQTMSWEMVCNKFNLLMANYVIEAERKDLMNVVADLENIRIRQLDATISQNTPAIKNKGQ